MRRLIAIALPPAMLIASVMFACRGSKLPAPNASSEPPNPAEGVCVDYPPPASKVEEVPDRPNDRAVWVDGQWVWKVSRWTWQSGGWVDPPAGATYSQWQLTRQPNGALMWWSGRWHTLEQAREERALGKVGGAPIECPPPPRPSPSGGLTAGVATLDATTLGDGEVGPPHVGPVREFPADAPSTSPGRVEVDGSIPSDAARAVDAQSTLIQPPP